jgi:hypothetical protein
VVIERTTTLRRLDRILEGIDEIAALTPVHAGPGRGHAYGRVLRDDDHRERGGEQPAARGELRHAPARDLGHLVDERLDAMRREVIVLRRAVLRAPEVVTPRVLHPMDERAFRAFVHDVRCAPFARNKVAVVHDVAPHTHFTSAQAAVVVRAIESWGQVDAAAALFPRVLDPESFHVVIGAVTFRSDQDELRRRIRRR